MLEEQRPRRVKVDEVIPPGAETPPADQSPVHRVLAFILDDLFQIPGTKLRFGLDPLLGLLPRFGDTVANLISTAMLSAGLRRGIPRVVIARMALNILVNALVGAIPVVGDAFSFWFKSNKRNYELFQKHATGRDRSTRGDWLFVIALTALVALGVIAVVAGMVALIGLVIQSV